GHEIGGELHAAELQVERGGEGADHERLRRAGDALEQDVASRQQRDEHRLERVFLTDDGSLRGSEDGVAEGAERRQPRREGLGDGGFERSVVHHLCFPSPAFRWPTSASRAASMARARASSARSLSILSAGYRSTPSAVSSAPVSL